MIDLGNHESGGNCYNEYQSVSPSPSSVSSSPSTSTIFGNEIHYPFQFFMEEQDTYLTMESSPSRVIPTSRSLVEPINIIGQQWKSDAKWLPGTIDSSSFFFVHPDRHSVVGNNNETVPSKEVKASSVFHDDYLTPRSTFAADDQRHRGSFGNESSRDYTAGGDTFEPHVPSPTSSPAFTDPAHSDRQKSYPGIYHHVEADTYNDQSNSYKTATQSLNATGLFNHVTGGMPTPPAGPILDQKMQGNVYDRPSYGSSHLFLNVHDKKYTTRLFGELEGSPTSHTMPLDMFSENSHRTIADSPTFQQSVQQKQYPLQQSATSLPTQSQNRVQTNFPLPDSNRRCNSFSAQSSVPTNQGPDANYHRQSYPSFQADRRNPAEVDSFNSFDMQQSHSQYMIDVQSQMRAQMIYQQQRMQEQHLQQQQLQQLHRLHTQQLKQVKQKSFEAKLQQPDRSAAQQRIPLDGPIYQVQFKCSHRYMTLGECGPQGIKVGSFVVVEADRGEDLGVVVLIAPRDSPLAISLNSANRTVPKGPEGELKKIIRLASLQERAELPNKAKDEMDILKICREWAPEKYNLSIFLVDAEYQFDRHKLVLYYSAARRIDFREFVRDLYAVYKTRIWMQPTDANNNFRPNEIAARALATGFLNQSPLLSGSVASFVSEPQSRINMMSLPPPVMSNGTGGEYGEHSLRSCPPSIHINTSGSAPIYWAVKAAPTVKASTKQTFIQQASTFRQPELSVSRQHVNTGLYKQHQQLQYGSAHRPATNY